MWLCARPSPRVRLVYRMEAMAREFLWAASEKPTEGKSEAWLQRVSGQKVPLGSAWVHAATWRPIFVLVYNTSNIVPTLADRDDN